MNSLAVSALPMKTTPGMMLKPPVPRSPSMMLSAARIKSSDLNQFWKERQVIVRFGYIFHYDDFYITGRSACNVT